MNNVALAVALMRVNDPTPAVLGDRTAIAAGPTGCVKLVSNDFPVFQWLLHLSQANSIGTGLVAVMKFDETEVGVGVGVGVGMSSGEGVGVSGVGVGVHTD